MGTVCKESSTMTQFTLPEIWKLAFTAEAQYEDLTVFGYQSVNRFTFILMKTKHPVCIMMFGMVSIHLPTRRQTQHWGQHIVPGRGIADLDRESGCWKTQRWATGFFTKPHKLENTVLAVKTFLRLHHLYHLAA